MDVIQVLHQGLPRLRKQAHYMNLCTFGIFVLCKYSLVLFLATISLYQHAPHILCVCGLGAILFQEWLRNCFTDRRSHRRNPSNHRVSLLPSTNPFATSMTIPFAKGGKHNGKGGGKHHHDDDDDDQTEIDSDYDDGSDDSASWMSTAASPLAISLTTEGGGEQILAVFEREMLEAEAENSNGGESEGGSGLENNLSTIQEVAAAADNKGGDEEATTATVESQSSAVPTTNELASSAEGESPPTLSSYLGLTKQSDNAAASPSDASVAGVEVVVTSEGVEYSRMVDASVAEGGENVSSEEGAEYYGMIEI